MSNYPPESYPPDPYSPEGYTPGAPVPPPLERDPYAASPNAMAGRVSPPAIALLVVAVLNLILGLGSFVFGAIYTQLTPEKLEETMRNQNPQQFKQMKEMGMSVQTIMNIYIYSGLGGGCVSIVISLLIALGAIRMMMLRSYGLAVFASVLAAVPFLSCLGCCGIGEGIGIWSLVVLLNPEVRAAFR
jgi:hypothetical protein